MSNTLTRDHFLCTQCQAVTQFRLALPTWVCPRCGAVKQPEARPSGLGVSLHEAPPDGVQVRHVERSMFAS